MFENERPLLCGMTLETGLVTAQERQTSAFHSLLHVGTASFDGHADMWIMAIGATDFAFEHGMMMRQLELRPNIKMTLETGFG